MDDYFFKKKKFVLDDCVPISSFNYKASKLISTPSWHISPRL